MVRHLITGRIRWLVAASLVASACQGAGSAAAPRGSTLDSGASQTSAPASNPLVGRWLQTYSCEQSVETFKRMVLALKPAQMEGARKQHLGDTREEVYLNNVRSDAAWGPNANHATSLSADALCRDAPDRKRLWEIDDGTMVAFALPSQQPEFATISYQLVDDHAFDASDGNENIDGTYSFTFRIQGDRMTVRQIAQNGKLGEADPWTGRGFEEAPLIRSAG